MSKQPKKPKRLPKPVPCWCLVIGGKLTVDGCFDTKKEAILWGQGAKPVRVRIVPVAAKAKRRKGAK